MNADGTSITHEQYLAMLEAQRHQCAICGTPINGDSHLDHNHDTGEPRGLLCQQCNMALGQLEPYIEQVAAYLQLATKAEPGEQAPECPQGYYWNGRQCLKQDTVTRLSLYEREGF